MSKTTETVSKTSMTRREAISLANKLTVKTEQQHRPVYLDGTWVVKNVVTGKVVG